VPRHPKGKWFKVASIGFLAAAVVCVVAAINVSVPTPTTSSLESGSPSIQAATPGAVIPSATPVATSTPISTPEPTTPAEPRQFMGATLSIPSIKLEGDITPYSPDELVDITIGDKTMPKAAVEPATADTIAWYTGIEGSSLSSDATNCNYIYGHKYLNGRAVFNDIYEMKEGSEAIISTGNGETLPYVFQSKFPVLKDRLQDDPRITEGAPGCLILLTCNSDGERDANGHTVENYAVRLQLQTA
jgi:hypothetical protein